MASKPKKLEEQASTAALYVTKGKDDKSSTKPSPSNFPLDEHNKLSSAGAATSLKHADPRDLPAFPVVGLTDPDSSAGAAASLANNNQKPFELWKPGEIPAANKAALLAKDYKMAPLWQSELSAAGSKAALLAAEEGGDVKIWRPSPTDAGGSAAAQAMRKKGLSPQLDYGHTEDGGKRALKAATQSMAGGRRRAGSTPTEPLPLYPDAKNSAANALKAATSVSRKGQPAPVARAPTGPPINAGKIHNAAVTNLAREMYTSHPPVAPEIEEKNREAGFRASAIAMAQQMYNVQQRAIEQAAADTRAAESRYGAAHAQNRPASVMSDESHAPPQYVNLQEAAQKLAAERLAKLHDEHAAYRTYYGTQGAQQSHKVSIRGRNRRRASSDGHIGEDDEERSRQIRSQMSLFTDKLAQVDNKKRQKDRESLMAAAQRNVRASMTAQDEKVFNETGKVSPAMMAEWEAKAKAKAEAESSTRMVNHGKVNIGGGRYMDQSEIEAIASAKVQPTLDEVTAKAEKQRARDEELRQQQLERERLAAEKEQDQKLRDQKTKEEWRRFKEEEKREARAKKEEERARKREERRLRDEEKQKAREAKAAAKGPVEAPKEEVASGPVAAEPEPPVLEPIPHVASIAPTEKPQVAPEKPETTISPELKATVGPGEVERIDPTFIPMSEMDEITASQANLGKVESKESELKPVVSAESGLPTTEPIGGDPEEIARRVFSSPVDNESATALERSTSETEELAKATSNIEEAPVVKAEITIVPAVEAVPPPSTAPALETTDSTAKKPDAPAVESPVTKPDAPVVARVAPPISAATQPAASTETTVSGPSTSSKPKESKGVSSWLKTKLRRTSRAIKPENTIPATDSKEKGFVGGANLKAPEASNHGSDHGDSSMREVAMAGKDTTTAGAELSPVVSPNDEDLYSASARSNKGTGAVQRQSSSSPSISSLSSDEDTRGRSNVPRDRDPLTQGESVAEELKSGEHIDPTLTAGGKLDPALMGHSKRESSSAGGPEEFEEARDTFDSEKLSPPDKSIIAKGRASDSPARDSRFIEEL